MNAYPDSAPIIQWIGGKRRLAEHILPLFPQHRCYVEPFAGACALYFAKAPVRTEVLNDVNGDLVNLYRIIKYHLEEFIRQFKWTLISRENWNLLSSTPPETLTDVQRAARFFYVHRLGFGGKVVGRTFGADPSAGPRINLLRIEEDLSAAHLRLLATVIERMDWTACVDRYDRPHSLFYMDPPYWETEGYGVPFELDQYELLAQRMRHMAGKAILSINDVPAMRSTFAGFRTKRVSLQYTVGTAGKARASRSELIVMNWK